MFVLHFCKINIPLFSMIALKILVALIGILLYTLWHAQNVINSSEWSLKTFIRDNTKQWLWSASMCITVAILTEINPEASEAIYNLTAINIADNITGFFTLGLGLSATIKPSAKEVKK